MINHYPHPKPQWCIRHNPPTAKDAAVTLKDCSPCLCCSLYLQTRLFAVPCSSHICCLQHRYREQRQRQIPRSLRQPSPTHAHPYALIANNTAHCTAERKFPLGVDCPKVQSNLTEAFLPYIQRYEKKAVFGRAMQGGRGVFSDRRKGKIPFQTLKCLIFGVLAF